MSTLINLQLFALMWIFQSMFGMYNFVDEMCEKKNMHLYICIIFFDKYDIEKNFELR